MRRDASEKVISPELRCTDTKTTSVTKRLGRKALRPLLGRTSLQPFFESLYELSLAGLNFGEGTDPRLSGERFVMRLIATRWSPSPQSFTVFDVGANAGVYTHELLDVLGDSARVWAFEPSPSSFRILESKLGGTANVHLRNLGFSDREGIGTLHAPAEGSKVASLYDTVSLSAPAPLAESITLTTLDRFCSDEDIERIHFLKLDVEGHELSVLKGGATLLEEGRVDAIQFEFSRANLESRTFLRDFFYLLDGRYRLYRVLRNGLYPMDRYKEVYEVYKRATNYLALLGRRDQAGL
jgi:FkbM family methyltransferase